MPGQDRANIVCIECHSRKIKCDLQTNLDGVCKNCLRSHRHCIKRSSVRTKRPVTRPTKTTFQAHESQSPNLTNSNLHGTTTGPIDTIAEQENSSNDFRTPIQRGQVIFNRCSSSYFEDPTDTAMLESSVPDSHIPSDILNTTRAANLPRPALCRAWTDAYRTHAFHHCPVIEQKDLYTSSSSSLLQLSICIVGNLKRHDLSGPKLAQEFYEKVKVLIAVNYEQDSIQLLKIFCLMSCWSGKPSNPICLDLPEHWIGIAARLILQVGLHQESAYTKLADTRCLRRIFWFIHNCEALQVACWGRPGLLRRKILDVKPPTLEDFEMSNVQSLVFLEITKLCKIMSCLSEHQQEKRSIQPEELANIEVALCDWMVQLPNELQLYDEVYCRRAYYRPVSEMFIQYFVTIILKELLRHRDGNRQWQVSALSLIAASCAVVLYDEIQCQDETIFLPPINGFFCLALALPLIHHVPQSTQKEASRKSELDIVRSVALGMQDRYGDSPMVLGKINNLEKRIHGTAAGDEPRDTTLPGNLESCAFAKELFPFPASFCDNMDLLSLAAVPINQLDVEDFVPMENWSADGYFFDSTFLDLFGEDFGESSTLFEGRDSELDIYGQVGT